MRATVFQLRASDPAGNGLAQAFLEISAVALWTVLAIVLVLTALRQQRYQLPWASINRYTLLHSVATGDGGTPHCQRCSPATKPISGDEIGTCAGCIMIGYPLSG